MPLGYLKKYWRILLALFAIPLVGTISFPMWPLFAVNELGGSVFESGLVFVGEAIVGMLAVPFLGRISDQKGWHRRAAVLGAIWLALGSLALGLSPNMVCMIVAGAVFFGMFGIPSSQLFAIARRELIANGDDPRDVSYLRTAYVAGWVVGPSLSGLLLLLGLGYREIFFAQGVLFLLLACLIFIAVRDRAPDLQAASPISTLKGQGVPLPGKLLYASVAFVLCGDIVRTAALPLLMSGRMGAADYEVSLAFSIVPLVEIPIALASAYAAKRFGEHLVIVAGVFAGLTYFLGMGLARSIESIYWLQVIYAVVPATTIGVGISYAQSLLPMRPGYAASLIVGAQNAAVLIGSVVLSLGGLSLGVQESFFIPAVFCLGALCLNLALFFGSGHRKKAK